MLIVLAAVVIRPAGTFRRLVNAFAAALGCVLISIHPLASDVPVTPLPAEVIGDVCSPIRNGATSVRFTVCTPDGKYAIRTKTGKSFNYLDRVRVVSEFTLPESPRNIGEFDYQAWCRFHHVRALSSPNAMVELIDSRRNDLGRFITDVRKWIDARCEAGLPSDTAPLASGILLSITDDLPYELQEAFGRTGTVHVLSTSGMHISVLVASIGTMLVWAGRSTTAAVGLGISVIIGYASGGGPAPIRAVTSLFARLCARLLMRPPEPWHLLCLCASCAMLRDPFVVVDAGAQLSFLAVSGLIVASSFSDVISQRIRQAPATAHKVSLTLMQGLLVSFIVTLITAPTVAYHMHHLSLISPVANLPVGILSEWALLTGALTVILGDIPGLGSILWIILHGILTGLIFVANMLAELPYADVATGVLCPEFVFVTSSMITAALIAIGKKVRKGMAVAESSYFVPWSPSKPVL
ncbi:MAG: ComEC/Rec2 family competence protein [Armatimonadota bacterium]